MATPSSTISETAKNLARRLEDYGRVPAEDIKELLAEEGMAPKEVGLVMGYGTARGREWRHKDGDDLVFGTKVVPR